ncbi:MAG TPA: Uma2 family endonuclease [Terriglobia bacterium]|nr:Uma2 family endonuclease [Terriglobia bacterium]
MTMVLNPPEERVVLRNLSWETYERLLSEKGDNRSPRFTFDGGTLEIMGPLPEHERWNLRIADLVGVLADEMNIEAEGFGATTFKREDLERGFEPDSCFYIQNVERLRGKERIDLETDPPPDLVIEIEITRSSIRKLPLFAAFGVPEVWRYDGMGVSIFRLEEGKYVDVPESAVLPGVSSIWLAELLERGRPLGRTGWLRLARTWARERFREGEASNSSPGT